MSGGSNDPPGNANQRRRAAGADPQAPTGDAGARRGAEDPAPVPGRRPPPPPDTAPTAPDREERSGARQAHEAPTVGPGERPPATSGAPEVASKEGASYSDRTLTAPASGAPRPAAAGKTPETIGPYPIEGELGRGGMGVVYRARDPRLKRPVALKVLPAAVAADPGWLERFEREAQLLAALNHPNIATIHSLEESGGMRFLTLELIAGENLSDRLDRGALDVAEALETCRQIAKALEAAHRNDVIHLDVKPGNVRITPDGLVKVLDFGLARAVEPDSTGADAAHPVAGTPGYMSPEQLRGRGVDHRADIWALGCILYECLSGTRYFARATLQETIDATLGQTPDLEALPAEIPPRVRELIKRSLEKDAADRLPTVAEFRRTLEDEVARRALREAAPTVEVPATAVPNNLPASMTSFVGRAKERARLRDLLASNRLVTLTGVGGCGKTRLAVEGARELLADFPDGVWLVELAPITNAELVPQALASAMGVKEERGRDLIDTLRAQIGTRPMLVIFDNCEHLVDACAQLANTLLQACAALRMIATSREALGITGENIWQVPSLRVPDPRRLPSPEQAAEIEALALFKERAKAVSPAFVLNQETIPAVVEICARLDGIPLAIELAAARVRALPATQIAARLDDRFRLLTGGSRTALPRHQTLRALIDWSYDNLPPEEQAMLRRLSVFSGGWTLEAAEAVCAGDSIEAWEILDLVTRLVDKSLSEATAIDDASDGPTRYRMLETVRQYARARLVERGEAEEAIARHRDFFLAFAEEAEPHLVGAEQGEWLRRLHSEHGNLRAALDSSQVPGIDPDLGLRLAGALGRFWEMRGHWSEGRRHYGKLLERANGADPKLRCKSLVYAGNLAFHQGDLDQAHAYYDESLRCCRARGDQDGLAQALSSLGLVAARRGDLDEACTLFEDGLALRRELGDKHGITTSLNNLGTVAQIRNDYPRARALYEESLAIKRELGDQRGVSAILSNLGIIAKQQREFERARELHEEALAIRRELGDQSGIAISLINLGNLAHDFADYESATRLFSESLEIKRELGDRRGVGVSLHDLGIVAGRLGDHARNQGLQQESLEIARDLGDEAMIGNVLTELGKAWIGLGDLFAARAALAEALALRRGRAAGTGLAAVLDAYAELAGAGGDERRAAVLLGASNALRERTHELRTPAEAVPIDAMIARVRASLGDAPFDAALVEGAAMSLEDVFGLALEESDEATP